MKKYLLSACVLSLLSITNAQADSNVSDSNVSFSGKREFNENLSGTTLSFTPDARVTVCPADDGKCVIQEDHLQWNFSERILSDGGTVSFSSTDLNVSAVKDTEGTVFKDGSAITLQDSNINSASRLEINSGSTLEIGKNSSVKIEDKPATSAENAPAKVVIANSSLSLQGGVVEHQSNKTVDDSYHTTWGDTFSITTTHAQDPNTGKITKTEIIRDSDGTVTETVSTLSNGATSLQNDTKLTKAADKDYAMIVDSSTINLSSEDKEFYLGTVTTTTTSSGTVTTKSNNEGDGERAIAFKSAITTAGDVSISNSTINMQANVSENLQDSERRNLIASTAGSITITDTTIAGTTPADTDNYNTFKLIADSYRVENAMYDRITAAKDLTIQNSSAQISDIVLESGNDMTLNTTGTRVTTKNGGKADISGNYEDLLVAAQKDITINANINAGGLATHGNINHETGTVNLNDIVAQKTTVSDVSNLHLTSGNGSSDIDAYGELTMYFFELTGDVYSENSSVNIDWGNTIYGDLTLNNSDLTMLKNDKDNSVFKVKNLTTTDSNLSLDTAHIEASGSVDIENADITVRVATNENDNAGFGHITADTINITNSTLGITVDPGVFSAAGEKKDYEFFNGTTSENLNIETLRSNSRYLFTDNGDGSHTIEMLKTAADMAGEQTGDDELSQMAGSLLDGAAGDNKFVQHLNELSQTPGREKEFADGLEALAPTQSAFITALANDTTRQIYNVIGTRFDRDSYRSKRTRQNMPSNNLWAQALASKGEFEGARAFETDSKGGAIGFDFDPCPGCRFGLGYVYTQSDVTAKNRTADVDSHAAVIYADMQGDPVYLNIIGTYMRSQYDEKKDVAGLMARADYDVDVLAAQAMLGYDLGSMRLSRNWRTGSLMPEIGVRYMFVKQHEYTDEADQKVNETDGQTITGVLGAHYTADYKMGSVIFYPDLRAAVTYDFVSDEMRNAVSLAGGTPYYITAERLDEFGVELGAEIGLRIANRMDVALSYLGMFRKDYTNHTGLANLKFRF